MAKSRKSDKSVGKTDESAETKDKTDEIAETSEENSGDATVDASTDSPQEGASATGDTVDTETGEDTLASEDREPAEAGSDAPDGGDASVTAADEGDDTSADLGDDTLVSQEPETDDGDKSASDTEPAPWGAPADATLEDTSPADTDTTPEETSPAPAAVAQQPQRRGSMWPAVFGGVIAAMVGFIAGRGDQLEQYLPASMQRTPVDLTALEAETEQLSEADAALQERLDALEAADDSALTDGISNLEASLAALVDRVASLEDRPIAVTDGELASSDAVAALQDALAAQQAEIEALSARAEEAEAQAASEARRILARAALARVVTAVDSGETFSPALQDLEETAPVEVPDPLRTAAENGVPTLIALRESFPDAARAGLAAARSDVPESEVQGLGAFLRRQLGARSVVPREGSDPDAVLSRAEAAVRAGDLSTALAELEALPDVSRAAMGDWLEAATARKAAQDAAKDLADSLNSN